MTFLFDIVASVVGAAYFIYGKKAERWNFIICGALLMFWPYFFSNVWLEFAGDIILAVIPFVVEF